MEFKKGKPIRFISVVLLIGASIIFLLYIIGFYLVFTFNNLPAIATKEANELINKMDNGIYKFKLTDKNWYINYQEDTNMDTISFEAYFFENYKNEKNVRNLNYTYSNNKLVIEADGDITNSTIEGLSKEDFKKNYLSIDYIKPSNLKAVSSKWNYFPNPFMRNDDFGLTINYESNKNRVLVSIPLINESFSYEIEKITNSKNKDRNNEIDREFYINFKPTNSFAGCIVY